MGAIETLEEVSEELEGRGILLRLFSAYQGVREMIRRAGHEDLLMDVDSLTPMRDQIQRWEQEHDRLIGHERSSVVDTADPEGVP